MRVLIPHAEILAAVEEEREEKESVLSLSLFLSLSLRRDNRR